jgi:serine/threonine protein phosphatase PrpC
MNLEADIHFSFSLKNPTKPKCGDASFSGIIKNNNNEFILLIAADGVSKAPKDYLASASVVKFIKEYLETALIHDIKEAFEEAVLFTNTQICVGLEGTTGMLSTLSALIYVAATGKIYTINIGDSRIFGYNTNEWNQLTTDDAARSPYKENGKLKLQNGVPIYMTGLKKAMGGDRNLSIEVREINADEYTGFALLTDGFYGIANWEKYVNELFNAADAKQLIERNTVELLGTITDDASLCMLRLPVQNISNVSVGNIGDSQYSKAMLQPFIQEQLDRAFKAKDISKISELVKLIDKHQIIDTRPNMILLLEKLIQFQASEAIQILSGLIRRM